MFKLDLEKPEEPEIKLDLLTSAGSQKKQENSRKTSAPLTTLKPLTVWITINCGKFLKRQEYQTTLPASFAGEKQVKTRHGTTDWFQTAKGVCQCCVSSPCLFNSYAEYIKRNAGLDEVQAGLKTAGRNVNNLTYADDTTLVAQREELKSLDEGETGE